jgi:uncharacterized protein
MGLVKELRARCKGTSAAAFHGVSEAPAFRGAIRENGTAAVPYEGDPSTPQGYVKGVGCEDPGLSRSEKMRLIFRDQKGLAWLILTACTTLLCGGGIAFPLERSTVATAGGSVKLSEISLRQVRIEDGFWSPRIEVNRSHSLDYQLRQCLETGRIRNFEIAAGLAQGEFQGRFYNDSDVYKWLEAASYSLATHPDESLEKKVDGVIATVAAAQEKDGYLNTFFQLSYPKGKWTNLALLHELYNAGHLIEAAVAHYEATGKKTLLDVAIRFADHIDSIFGPGKRDGTSGHEEVELALVKLYHATGERRYLQLAAFFLNQRGQKPSYFEKEYARLDPLFTFEFKGERINFRTLNERRFLGDPKKFDTSYCQDHLPVRQQSEVVGHAVRAMYLYSGMADVAYETGDQGLLDALNRLHENVTLKRMYVTGGIGPSKYNEGFTTDYDLPNDTAYQETCASVGMVFWNYRMLKLTGDGRYADVMEQSLYNCALAGVSLSGDRFFYINPLYSSGVEKEDLKLELNRFSFKRQAWFGTACCPVNLARLFPSLGKYIYSQSLDGLWVNLYVGGSVSTQLANGAKVDLRQASRYPWEGKIHVDVRVATPQDFSLHLRIPGWASDATVQLNGSPVHFEVVNGYASLNRRWANGDTIDLLLPMEIQLLEANPQVVQDRGKVTLRRGPLIYCLEQIDQSKDLDEIVLPMSAKLESRFEPQLLNGVATIVGQGQLTSSPSWHTQLYRPSVSTPSQTVPIKAIPYYAWANRQQGKMTVWIQSSR